VPRAPLTKGEQAQAAALIAQARVALIMQGIAGLGTVALTLWEGLPGFLFGCLLVGLFRLARPAFPPDLARKLERD
jgi:hypothetical protein